MLFESLRSNTTETLDEAEEADMEEWLNQEFGETSFSLKPESSQIAFDSLVEEIEQGLERLNQKVNAVTHQMNRFGCKRDTAEFRMHLNDLLARAQVDTLKMETLIKELRPLGMSLTDDGEKKRENKQRSNRLEKDYLDLTKQVESLSHEIKLKSNAYSPVEESNERVETREREEDYLHQIELSNSTFEDFQLQPMGEEEFQATIMEEEEQHVEKVTRDITLINEAFQDFAILADEQSCLLNDIEEMASETRNQTRKGREQLSKAEVYHKRNQARKFCLYFTLGLFALFCCFLVYIFAVF